MHIIYAVLTGEILGWLDCPDHLLDINVAPLLPHKNVIPSPMPYDGEFYYINTTDQSIQPRVNIPGIPNQLTILANSPDMFVLTGLPIPCVVKVEDAGEYSITDGEFGFSTPLPGIYKVTAERFPYLSKTWEVVAI